MTDATTSAKDLVARMREGWTAFRLPAATLGEDGLARTTPVGWTYRDLLAHVAAWHDLTARRLTAFAADGTTSPPSGPAATRLFEEVGLAADDREALQREWDQDRFNAAVARAAAGRAPADVYRSLDDTFARVVEAVSALTDEQVAARVEDGRPFVEAIVAGNTYDHYAEHADEIAADFPADARALLQRVDRAWSAFREAVRHVGRAGLAAQTSSGWTKKDLLAHVIGWLQEAPRRIAAARDGTATPMSRQEIDERNARVVASHALVGPEALVDELDTSYRGLRDAIAELTPDEVRQWRILVVVATRTYLHWREHEPELRA